MDPRMNEWGSVQSLRPPGHGWGRKSACTQLHTITHMHRHTHRTGRLASCIHSHTDTHTLPKGISQVLQRDRGSGEGFITRN